MNTELSQIADNPTAHAGQGEYLTFSLDIEDYCVDILRVREIRGWEEVTRIPNSPFYVKGVLNLRGTIVPVFDLRQRLDMPFRAYEKETVVIILRVLSGDVEKNIGIVVDTVSEVLYVSSSDIQPSPDFGTRLNTKFINGLVSANEKMVMLLDVDKLITFSSPGSEFEENKVPADFRHNQTETGADSREN